MKTIRNICIAIKNITEKDLKAERKVAIQQQQYISPLKPATQAKQNNLGYRNSKILDKLVELKELIRENKPEK